MCGMKEILGVSRTSSSMEDTLALFFHTLYLWTVAFLSSLSLSFFDFFARFSLPS
jgi:hypothetical protein